MSETLNVFATVPRYSAVIPGQLWGGDVRVLPVNVVDVDGEHHERCKQQPHQPTSSVQHKETKHLRVSKLNCTVAEAGNSVVVRL